MTQAGKVKMASVLKVVVDVGWYLTLFAAFVIVVGVPLELYASGSVPVNLFVAFSLGPPAEVLGAGPGGSAAFLDEALGLIKLRTNDAELVALFVTGALLVLGLLLVALHQLRLIFRTLVAGTPFAAENVARIRVIGGVVLFWEGGRAVVMMLAARAVRPWITEPGLHIRSWPAIDVEIIFLGLVLIVLAEVFRIGNQLREDADLTV